MGNYEHLFDPGFVSESLSEMLTPDPSCMAASCVKQVEMPQAGRTFWGESESTAQVAEIEPIGVLGTSRHNLVGRLPV